MTPPWGVSGVSSRPKIRPQNVFFMCAASRVAATRYPERRTGRQTTGEEQQPATTTRRRRWCVISHNAPFDAACCRFGWSGRGAVAELTPISSSSQVCGVSTVFSLGGRPRSQLRRVNGCSQTPLSWCVSGLDMASVQLQQRLLLHAGPVPHISFRLSYLFLHPMSSDSSAEPSSESDSSSTSTEDPFHLQLFSAWLMSEGGRATMYYSLASPYLE